jgi:uncharacterized protein YkwD
VERIPHWLAGLACTLAFATALPATAFARGGREPGRCVHASATVHDKAAERLAARTALLCLMNRERHKHGLPLLTENRRLFTAALGHSRWMVRNRYFSHYRPGGPDLVGRLKAVNYIPRSGSWLVGENIGYGLPRRSSPADQVRFWMKSPLHRANILNPRFRAAGLGIWSGTPRTVRGATYTIDFGSRR